MHAWTLYVREPGDLKDLRRSVQKPERLEKACGYTSNVYVLEKSDTNVVPEKEPNKAVSQAAAEVLEGRTVTKGNPGGHTCDQYAATGANIEWT